MKRFDMEIQPQPYYMGEGKSYAVSPYESTNGDWVKWDDVQANTIPIPDVRVEDEGLYDPRDRWAVYVNNRCMGIHADKQNAENQAEYIIRALNIPQ